MTAIRKLAGGQIFGGDAASLRLRCGITTVTDLWERIGTSSREGVDRVSIASGIPRGRLVELLIEQGLSEAARKDGTWLGRNALQMVALVLLVALAAAAIAVRVWLPSVFLPPGAGEYMVVVTRDSLPAHHLITDQDVTERQGATKPGAVAKKQDAENRYVLTSVPPGETLSASHLSKPCVVPDDGLRQRHIVSLQVRASALVSVSPGVCVDLILSPRDWPDGTPAESRLLRGASVLSVNRAGEASSVLLGLALTDDDRDALPRLLGRADVFLLQRPV